MTYSSVSDMLVGDVRHGVLDAGKFVQDAADEIDSRLGHLYKTPLAVSGPTSGLMERHSILLIKKINNHIASGRFLMAASAGDESIHSYGRMLVREAYAELNRIADGVIVLDGAEPQEGLTDTTGPTILTQDDESPLDAFYSPVMDHKVFREWSPGRMPS